MVLYCRVSLNAFVESFRNTSGPDSFFTLPAKGLMHIVPQEEIEYGLSLFRESIGLYEERKGIPVEKSKKAMPFFRQDSRMLVGPEIGMYVIPLYEEPGEPAQSAEPSLVLELDYQSLGELCLFENYSLLSCKYEKEPILNHFKMVQDRLLLILAGQQGIILEQAKLAQRLIVQLKDQRRLGRLGRLTGFLIQRDHVHAYLRPHQHPAVLSEKGHRLLALFHRYPFAFLIQADRLPKQGKPILDLLLRHDMHQPLRRKREKGIRPRGIPKAFDKSVQ